MGSRAVYALRFHADYRCRDSGACCTANWDVPVELPIYRSLRDAVSAGTLRTFDTGRPDAAARASAFIVAPDLPEGAAAILERDDEGRCVFYASDAKRCIVHRDLGEAALPATCRHFPRIAVQDPRGVSISLSHFCPTAAAMLFREDAVEVVAEPPAFPEADYEGLVVTIDDLPPLLTPRMLMDLDGYSAWERHMVARCSDVQQRPASVVATLWRDAHRLGEWKPGGATLREAIAQLPPEYVSVAEESGLQNSLRRHREVIEAVPDDLKPDPDESGLHEAMRTHVAPEWERFHPPVNRYLAAKAFASWTAYQGRGIKTIVRGLEAALALVRVEAARQCRNAARALDRDLLLESFREADFLLNHLAVGEDLAKAWSQAETM
jgi:Fe-S-cluster containining protein